MDLKQLQSDPAAFRQVLLIDTDNGPLPFTQVMDDWQRSDFEALDNGWKRAARQKVDGDCYSRAFLLRPRGHSKSSDAMVMAAWALFASRRQISGIVAAVDKDQAKINRDHLAKLLSLNPWLAQILKVHEWKITNIKTGSNLTCISSDVASSWGLLVDFVCCDELTVWSKRDLFDSLLSAVAKRKHALLLCIQNAGFAETWQAKLRDQICDDPSWYYHSLDGPVASWIDQKRLAEQERLLPPAAYERIWLNQFCSAAGDAISRADIAAAFKSDLEPMPEKQPGWEFLCGVDIGVSRHGSGICVLGVRKRNQWEADLQDHGRIRLAFTKVWQPPKGGKINLQEIEDTILALHSLYDFKQVMLDPYQATHILQRCILKGVPAVELPQTGLNLQKIATVFIEAFADRRLDLYPEPQLESEIKRLRCEERSYGFRLVSPEDSVTGMHGDLCSAFQFALFAASETAGKKTIRVGSLQDTFYHHSPFERDIQEHLQNQQDFQDEQHFYNQPEDSKAPLLRALMYKLGRTNSPL